MKNKGKKSQESEEAYRLVYSTDPVKKSDPISETGFSGLLKPAVRIERKGRNGKTVTILFKLPQHETLLKDLCGYLKRALGSGGTYAIEEGEGTIEIQGDHREQIPLLVEKYSTKK